MHWNVITNNLDFFAQGVGLTLQISAWALLFSIPIGVLLGLMRISKKKILYIPATCYVEFVRGVPLLVILFWIYFVAGTFFSLGSYWAGVAGLSLFSGAFIAEIVRAGIEAIPKGQMEAARSSGMSYMQAMRFVILPQAIRVVLPPMASQFIILIKDSSLVSVIALSELTLVAKNLITTTMRAMEIWTFVALLYFVMTFTLTRVIRYFEKKYSFTR